MGFRYVVDVAKGSNFDPLSASALVKSLKELCPNSQVQLRLETDGKEIYWSIQSLTAAVEGKKVRTVLSSLYPHIQIYKYNGMPQLPYPYHQRVIIFKDKVQDHYLPRVGVQEIKGNDPLIKLTSIMDKVQTSERLGLVIADQGTYTLDGNEIEEELTQSIYKADPEFATQGTNGFFEALGSMFVHLLFPSRKRVPRLSKAEEHKYRAKLEQLIYGVTIGLYCESPDPNRLDLLTSAKQFVFATAQAPFSQFEDVVIKDVVLTSKADWIKYEPSNLMNEWSENEDKLTDEISFHLTADEIATLWHLPYEGFTAAKINWADGVRASLPNEMRQENKMGLLLGYGIADGNKHPAYILPQDRATHMIVTGEIGMGKSTLIHNLVQQDIKRGNGVAVIDPKGNLIHDILRSDVLPGRVKDVVIWNLADTECPPPLNFLLQASGIPRDDAAATVMSVFSKIYGSDFAYARMGQTLVFSLQAIMGAETPTLRDVSKLFRDPTFRRELIARLDNPAAEEFWSRFETASERAQQDQFDPVLRRLELLYGDKVLYPIFCQPKMLNVRELMEQKKIVLISLTSPSTYNLTRDKLDLLGSLLVSEFQLAVSSVDLPEPFYLYIDEAHRFVTAPLDEIFILARQRKLSLTLATQYPKQLPAQTFDAVMETVGAIVAFQCGDDTARILQRRMEPEFEAKDLINLEVHDAAVRMRYAGKQMRPFLLKTLDAPEPDKPTEADEQATRLRELSLEQNGFLCRDDIQAWQQKRYPRSYPSAQVKPNTDAPADDYDEFAEPDENED